MSVSDDGDGRDVAKARYVSRRTLVRTGATAAWAVPVISVATAAPAMAAVSGGLSVSGSGSYANKNSTALPLTITVTNNRTSAASGCSVTVSFPSGWTPSCTQPSGWTVSTGNAQTHTFNSSAAIPGSGTTTFTSTFTVTSAHKGNAVQIGLTASSTGYDSAAGGISVAAGTGTGT